MPTRSRNGTENPAGKIAGTASGSERSTSGPTATVAMAAPRLCSKRYGTKPPSAAQVPTDNGLVSLGKYREKFEPEHAQLRPPETTTRLIALIIALMSAPTSPVAMFTLGRISTARITNAQAKMIVANFCAAIRKL